MTSLPLALLALSLSADAGAANTRPDGAADRVSAVVLVYGGGTTAEAGEAAMTRLGADREFWKELLHEAEGYPRLVQSVDVEGLKPGFHVVLLGACEPAAVEPILAAFRAIVPGVYARPVKLPPRDLGCPTFEPDWSLSKVVTKKFGRSDLTVAAFEGPTGGFEGAMELVLSAHDAKGTVTDRTHDRFCQDAELSSVGDALLAKAKCVTERCTTDGYTLYTGRYRVDGAGKIVAKNGEKVLSKAWCD